MNNPGKGELAFLPSDITLLKFKSDNSSPVDRWVKTDKPCHVLVVDKHDDNTYTKVLYDGECWMARKQDLYPARS